MLVTRHALRLRLHLNNARWASRKVLQKFKLADIGEGITECEVVKWNLKPPAPVQAFDQLCEVQSDKASVEITSPFDGILKELLVEEGAIAKVGEGLCLIEVEEEEAASSPLTEPVDGPKASPPPHQEQEASELSSSNAPPPPPPQTEECFPRRRHPMDPKHIPPTPASSSSSKPANSLATPSMRHLARSLGVDLDVLAPGSGRGGRIERRDIDAYLSGTKAEQPQDSAAPPQDGEEVVLELNRTRYGMWKAMEKSLEIPHFGYSTSLDLTRLHALLPLLNANIPSHFLPPSDTEHTTRAPLVSPTALAPLPSPPSVPETGRYTRLTYLPFLLKTLALAMQEWPLFRTSITPSSSPGKPTLTLRPHADIALALSTPTGLYTPVLAAADTLSAYALASRVTHLAALGRRTPCGLTPKEMPRRGGTLTVSNVGAVGRGEWAHPVLVPGGGVAIAAIGRARWVYDAEEGVWDEERGRGERRLKVGVSWSADHRVVEGAELAAFVECWRGWVESPERLIAAGV